MTRCNGEGPCGEGPGSASSEHHHDYHHDHHHGHAHGHDDSLGWDGGDVLESKSACGGEGTGNGHAPSAALDNSCSSGCCGGHDYNDDHDADSSHHHSHHHHHDDHPAEQNEFVKVMDSSEESPIDTIDGRNHQQHYLKEIEDEKICLAFVRESGAEVVVFDASGKPRSFSARRAANSQGKLCFKSHGSDGQILTPCFDPQGNHGAPEESCFCGVETPHLHAHVHDPQFCDKVEDEKKNKKMHMPASQLHHHKHQHHVDGDDHHYSAQEGDPLIKRVASHVLHPTDNVRDGNYSDEETPLVMIQVSEGMPKQCNSKILRMQMKQQGITDKHSKLNLLRLHQVRHEDHVDYLVQNRKTGDLILEHPCADCGDHDVHGQFRKLGQRSLSNCKHEGKKVTIHFFEVASVPFSIFDFFRDAFELKSDRVAAVENILDHVPAVVRQRQLSSVSEMERAAASAFVEKKLVRSTLSCKGICCSSEVPMVKRILNTLPGITRVMVNVPLKQVMVDHDPMFISAQFVAEALNDNMMGASVIRDGGAVLSAPSVASTPASTLGRSQFYVQHICCASEIPAINKIIQPIGGVSNVSINTTTKMVYVDHDTTVVSAQIIVDALNSQGFGADVRIDAAAAQSGTDSHSTFVQSILVASQEFSTSEVDGVMRAYDASLLMSYSVDSASYAITAVHNQFGLSAQTIANSLFQTAGINAVVKVDGASPNYWKQLASKTEIDDVVVEPDSVSYPKRAVILSGIFWIISMLSYIGGNWNYLEYASLLSIVFGIPSIALKALRTLHRRQIDTNCLMLSASLGAVALREFTEAAAVVFLFSLSEWLEVRATFRARQALSAIVQLRPEKANVVDASTRELFVVPASVVPVGTLVVVKAGDKVPCDGIILEGDSTVDESSLTGESRPVQKAVGDEVSGGTVNCGLSQLMVRTSATADDSAVSRLIRLVEEAQANRSETEKLVDEFASVYTPIVVLTSLLMCSIPWAFGHETGKRWTFNGLVLLVVACPCALIISTPVSYVAGLAATARRGILIKGGATLEALGVVKHVFFDKTGTLTNGHFQLLKFKALTTVLPREELFQYLALMEERSSHPVAHAILEAARNEKANVRTRLTLEKHTILNGEGVSGVINMKQVHVGNERLFTRLGMMETVAGKDREEIESWRMLGGTVGFMSIEGYGIVCAFTAADGIREEAATVVSNLKRRGINVTMLTGDSRETALSIGRQVGLSPDDIKSKLLPDQKLDFVRSMTMDSLRGSVMYKLCNRPHLSLMCGDGVNDAPALAAANVGVAMGQGAALAMETADVTLLDSNLEKLEFSMLMGRRVVWKIQQNVAFSLIVKLIVIVFALMGKTRLWAAIAADVGAMIIVTLNSMMLLPAVARSERSKTAVDDIELGRGAGRSPPSMSPLSSHRGPVEAKLPDCDEGCCSHQTARHHDHPHTHSETKGEVCCPDVKSKSNSHHSHDHCHTEKAHGVGLESTHLHSGAARSSCSHNNEADQCSAHKHEHAASRQEQEQMHGCCSHTEPPLKPVSLEPVDCCGFKSDERRKCCDHNDHCREKCTDHSHGHLAGDARNSCSSHGHSHEHSDGHVQEELSSERSLTLLDSVANITEEPSLAHARLHDHAHHMIVHSQCHEPLPPHDDHGSLSHDHTHSTCCGHDHSH